MIDELTPIAISIGMRLYQLVPKHVTAKVIVQTALMTAGLATRSAAT